MVILLCIPLALVDTCCSFVVVVVKKVLNGSFVMLLIVIFGSVFWRGCFHAWNQRRGSFPQAAYSFLFDLRLNAYCCSNSSLSPARNDYKKTPHYIYPGQRQ